MINTTNPFCKLNYWLKILANTSWHITNHNLIKVPNDFESTINFGYQCNLHIFPPRGVWGVSNAGNQSFINTISHLMT